MSLIEIVKPNWDEALPVKAFTTTRLGGVSLAPFDSLNLGLNTDDSDKACSDNQQRLITEKQLPNHPCYLKQVHGSDVSYNPAPTNLIEADSAITDKIDCVLAIQTADCLPILLADKNGLEVAAIHAGWRSLCHGIVENTVHAMKTSPSNLCAWLGPCISIKHFEVGPEVVDAFKANNRYQGIAHTIINGRDHLSLKAIARMILEHLGLTSIELSDHCTYQEKDKFYSYRRDKTTGRMASLIWLTR